MKNGWVMLFAARAVLIFLSWMAVAAPARAACTVPDAEAGDVIFNQGAHLLQYCNGTDWIAFPRRAVPCDTIATWTRIADYEHAPFNRIAYGNGLFVATQGSGDNAVRGIWSSPDGATWTRRQNAASMAAVAFGNNMFVALQSLWNGSVYTSPDGISWALSPNPLPPEFTTHLVFANGVFVASRNESIATSTNGMDWTVHNIPGGTEWGRIAYGNNRFVVAALHPWDANPNMLVSGDNGVSWDSYNVPIGAGLLSVAFGHGIFVAVHHWGQVHVSADGINWQQRPNLGNNHNWYAVTFNGRIFLAVGSPNPGGGAPDPLYAISYDGLNWSSHSGIAPDEWNDIIFANNRFITVSNATGGISIAPCGGPCGNPVTPPGGIIFNGDRRVMQWCDGNDWQALGPLDPAGPNDGCEEPVRDAGFMMFSEAQCALQYCDGDTWRTIGKTTPGACP